MANTTLNKDKQTHSNTPSNIDILAHHETERAKIAQKLENSTAQLLANAVFELAALQKLLDEPLSAENKPQVLNGIAALQTELEAGLANLRFLLADLEPNSVFGIFGLIAGLRRYLEKFEAQTGLHTKFEVHTHINRLPNLVEIGIFRVIQASLQYSYQKSGATEVSVVVKEQDHQLQFISKDNGTACNQADIWAYFEQYQIAFFSPIDIANSLSGQLHIQYQATQGSEIILALPYQKIKP